MAPDQLRDILQKYLKDNPEKRHLELAYLLFMCMNDAAVNLGYKQKNPNHNCQGDDFYRSAIDNHLQIC
jgi:hypothetical protein